MQCLDRPSAFERFEDAPTCAGRSAPPAAYAAPPRRTRSSSLSGVNRRPVRPSSSDRMPLRNDFLERAADRHRLAHRLHLRRQRRIGFGELLEVPPRNLGDDVVDGRLEGGGSEAGDVVGDLVQVIAERQLGRDLRDRKPGGLRRQRRRPRHARVHLDDDHPAVFRVHRELDVRAAGLDADPADDPPRRIAHPLVFLVRQRQRRRDGDAVAGVDAHRVDILDRADDDEVVGDVAHHLELVFLPADDRFLDQDLVDGAHARVRARPVRGIPRCCRRCRRRRRRA